MHHGPNSYDEVVRIEVTTDRCGYKTTTKYNADGEIHCLHGPAVIIEMPHDPQPLMIYKRNGKMNNSGGPTVVWPGLVELHTDERGAPHRIDGPAMIHGERYYYGPCETHCIDGRFIPNPNKDPLHKSKLRKSDGTTYQLMKISE